MINTAPFEHCECMRMGNAHALCQSELSLEERGKKVCLIPRTGEEAKAVVMDGCVLTDNNTKCDAIFLWAGRNRKVAALVELKGVGDIPHAFEQLAYTRRERPEYSQLVDRLNQAVPGPLHHLAFVVTNGLLGKPEQERLENQWGIRVKAVLHSEPRKKVPDLRYWL